MAQTEWTFTFNPEIVAQGEIDDYTASMRATVPLRYSGLFPWQPTEHEQARTYAEDHFEVRFDSAELRLNLLLDGQEVDSKIVQLPRISQSGKGWRRLGKRRVDLVQDPYLDTVSIEVDVTEGSSEE